MSTSETLQLYITLQSAVTLFLIILFWSVHSYLRQQRFFWWWTWAWTFFGVFLAAGRLALSLADQPDWVRTGLIYVSSTAGYFVIPFLVCGAVSFAHAPPERLHRHALVLVLVLALVFLTLSTLYPGSPTMRYALRHTPRYAGMAAAFLYCAFVFWRSRHEVPSRAAAVTAFSCLVYGLAQLKHGLDGVQHIVGSFAPSWATYLSWDFGWGWNWFLVDMGCQAGIGLGMVMLLVEQHRRGEKALQLSEEKFSRAFRASPDAVIIGMMGSGRLVEVNEAFLKQSGYTREEVIGRRTVELNLWVDLEQRERVVARLREHGRVHDEEIGFRTKAGEVRVALVSAEAIDVWGVQCALWVVRDITERRWAERALQASEKRHRELVDASQGLICAHDLRGKILSVNPAAARALGYEAADLVGRNLQELLAASAQHMFPHYIQRIREQRGDSGVMRVATKAGEERFWLYNNALQAPQGKDPYVLGHAQDITALRRTEMALKESESKYRSLVERAPYGICRISPQGRFLSANPALLTMLGYESEEDLLRVDIANDIFRDRQEIRRFLRGPSVEDRFEGVEAEWKRRDGAVVTVRFSGQAVRDETGELISYEAMVENITEQRLLEERFRQAQKMEAVGRLAGGVAHDFNNLLMVISGHVELLHEDLGKNRRLRAKVEEIRKAAQRGASLTQQLLAFSRKQVLRPTLLDLNAIVSDLGSMLRRLIGEDIELTTRLAKNLGPVEADRGQIEQVILNLVVNAREAMPRGGRLLLETANVEREEDGGHSARTRAESHVMLAVSDTGTGMDKETQAHIFEPFYTTKEDGRGTGLGLATVYGIVKQSQGSIWVDSRPGEGSTFRLYFPWAKARKPVEAPETSEVPSPAGSETVLLVEDEEPVRRLARHFLEARGYRVLEAQHGRAALDAAERFSGPIHLLLTDVVMPGMSGGELAERLARQRPGIKVLFVSGYTDGTIVPRELLNQGAGFLQKPFSLGTLARTVHEMLQGAPSR